MRVLIVMKGGSASIEGEVEQGSEEDLAKILNADKSQFIVVGSGIDRKVVSKSAIGYIMRKR